MDKKCVLCNGKKYTTLYDLGNWSINRCISCGLVNTLGKQSVEYSSYHRDEDYKEYESYFKNIFQKRFDIISSFKENPGNILDIGASTGVLLAIFKDRGWKTWGVEPSKAGQFASEKGIKVIKNTFEKASIPLNTFDVVVMNHTLEHVDNPVVVLKKIHSILKKRGIVYIDVPNFASFSSQLAGKTWKYLLPNEHIHHFEPQTLTRCLEIAGFNIKWTKTWSGVFDVSNPFLKFWQTGSGFKKQFFTDFVDIPGNIVATAFNRGTSLAMIGEK